MLALALTLSPGMAEGLNLGGLDQYAQSQGFDAAGFLRKLLSGESLLTLTDVTDIPGRLLRGVRVSLSGLLVNLMLPVAACALLGLVLGAREAGFMLNQLCALCCGKVLAQAWLSGQRQVTELIDGILRATERLTPVMASVAALTGGSLWSTAAGPLSNLCASILQRMLRDWGIRLCTIGAVVALSGAMASRSELNRLFDLLKHAAHWLLGGVVFVYGALLSAQGMLSAAGDGAAVQAAKVAIEGVVPIIGGGVSGAAGALAVSAGLLRSALGITGLALIARICLGPVLKLGGQTLALKLLSAIMEPLADGAAARLIGHFGDLFEVLLALSICSGVLAGMLPAGLAALSGGLT